MQARKLGWSGLDVSPLGLGCWAIGGPTRFGDHHFGWGEIDEGEAIAAIQLALDSGVTYFDTSDIYGTGHSERILGKALAGRRDQALIATKFGLVFDEYSGVMTGRDASPAHIQRACEASLRRLGTDRIDLYQFHIGDYDPEQIGPVCDTLDGLVEQGKIRYYAWSTEPAESVRAFARRAHCPATQISLNLFVDNPEVMAVCDEYDLAVIARSPLGKGLFAGRFDAASAFPANDLRHDWNLREGSLARRREALERLREILTSDGRTLAQAAFGALWARSERIIPIPGFKTVAQVRENAGALAYGPLSSEQMAAVAEVVATLTDEEREPF